MTPGFLPIFFLRIVLQLYIFSEKIKIIFDKNLMAFNNATVKTEIEDTKDR
jgi:hypothetical protein